MGRESEIEARANTRVRRREGERWLGTRRLKHSEPSIMAAMKEAKIVPYGRLRARIPEDELWSCAALRAGLQKNTL
jgi:hypothetical protein